MKCLECDCTEFEIKQMRFSPEIKGEAVDVIAPCYVCTSCHTQLMDDKQMNELRRAAADKYREQHNILTSKQIIQFREALGMSQSTFANYLSVGEASVKRWETYYVQDASQNDHIRIKCDEAYAELNFLNIQWKHSSPDIYSGNKKFSLELFKNIALYLIEKTNAPIIYLNKLHFYIDFYHFKKFKESISGARYIPLKYGPCPDQYRTIYDSLENSGLIKKTSKHTYKTLSTPDLSLFDDQEKQTLEHIFHLFKSQGGKALFDLSHREKAFSETEECTFISYQLATELLI